MKNELSIQKLQNPQEAEICASMMANSEPWLTLGRGYDHSLATLLHPDKEVYLARIDNEIVACMVLNMHGALIGYIQLICVSGGHRGIGIGSKLLSFAEERIASDSNNVFLMVSSFNENAKRLYERSGYQSIGELKDFVAEGYSEILMRTSLK